MSKLVIKKHVSLDFLGKEYKESYLVFRSIAVPEYTELQKKLSTVNNEEANDKILSILKDYYISGKFPNDDGVLEDIDGGKDALNYLDLDTLITCFGALTGQNLRALIDGSNDEIDIDPKSDKPSKPA